ncbi:MAG: putative DNA-binding domain-containing protein [Verrucomicrobia bacterium]|nr:putative DNA-binding domain-containing protein [Verrucomicrobiota bacterium]
MTPIGLKSPPARLPRRQRTTADLRAMQRLMAHALYQPLTPADDLAPRFRDGRAMADVAASFIKPNDRLSSLERLQIYARCYWYRVIDCVYDDSPGLRALLGEQRFSALVRAYLAKYPSRSFTLRNLCSRLPQFIRDEPRWTAPRTALAHAVARFEWAQTVAFDGEARPVLTRDDFADAPPAKLRLALQPYVTLLAFDWPVDDYVIAVKQRDALRGEASHAVDHGPRAASHRRVPWPRRGRVHVVVHRYDHRLFYKRVESAAFRVLEQLAAGRTLAQAIAAAGARAKPDRVREWFATWMELGWFCRR